MKLLSLSVFGAALCSLRSAANRALAQDATVAGPLTKSGIAVSKGFFIRCWKSGQPHPITVSA